MKQRDLFWSCSALLALAMCISLHCIQEPLSSGVAGGLCAFASAILLGFGLRVDTQERTVAESKRIEEKQKQSEALCQAQRECMNALLEHLNERFDAQQKSSIDAVDRLQANVIAEISALKETFIKESQLQSKAFDQREQQLLKVLENIAIQMDSTLSAADGILASTENQEKTLKKLKDENSSLQEKLQALSETLETQGKESRDSMEHIIQCYSNVTAQDIAVLTALAGDSKP